ncbi:MAG: SDR family NAD(P)-dependent oxidoreductase [Polyangiaceae bacterium]|nr:SDR family NAD(P)-dependent oxidoreductase [Polyangiaceae bacterium]
MTQTVLVTGASTGIGRAIATRLSSAGHRVIGTSRDPSRVDKTPYPLLQLDVRDDASVARCVAGVGPVDALVNNAGYAFVGAVEETSIAEAKAQMETNCFGALRMMHAVLPAMRSCGAGRIVVISSISGVVPPPFLGAYAASKHAIEAFTESLSHEVRDCGVRLTLVELDSMRTGITFTRPERADQRHDVPRGRMLRRLEHGSAHGDDPALVAEAVVEILARESPPLRWLVGERTVQVVEARRKLPEPAFAELVRRQLGLWEEA